MTVLVVSVFLINEEKYESIISQSKFFQSRFAWVIVKFGVASYSLYLWHQVILAFYRNTIQEDFAVIDYVATIVLSVIVGFISYYLIERSFTRVAKKSKKIFFDFSFQLCFLPHYNLFWWQVLFASWRSKRYS